MRLPGNAAMFFSQILSIALLDIIPTEWFYKKFEFTQTEPIDLNFEAIGFESTNFLKSIGSMIFPLAFILILIIVVTFLYLIKPCRK